jgi:hypothetical protein
MTTIIRFVEHSCLMFKDYIRYTNTVHVHNVHIEIRWQ